MPQRQNDPCVYLAGPDVFFPDAMERAARMKQRLAELGMVGQFPLDTTFDPADFADEKGLALAIAKANETLMRQADIILANIQPWRGPEADDGTSYEIGFMAALGKLIVLYTNDTRPFSERIIDDVYQGQTYEDGPLLRGASDDMMIEAFGLADNLMLINAATESAGKALGQPQDPAAIVQHGFEAAVSFAQRLWQKGG